MTELEMARIIIDNAESDLKIGRKHLDDMFKQYCKNVGECYENISYNKLYGAIELAFYAGLINDNEWHFLLNSIREVRDCFG